MICVEELPRFPASIDEVAESAPDAAGVLRQGRRGGESQGRGRGRRVLSRMSSPAIRFRASSNSSERGGYDLLVVGFMGHSALYNRVIGSTTDRLVELAPCKVLVVK